MKFVYAQDCTPARNVQETERGKRVLTMNKQRVYDSFHAKTTLNNWRHNRQKRKQTRREPSPEFENTRGYLIITPPSYLPAVYRFRNWKLTKGYNAMVYPFSRGTMSEEEACNEILSIIELYNEYGCDIQYLLLVGNVDSLPGKRVTRTIPDGTFNYLTDYYYECMGYMGTNAQNICCGRIPVSTMEEAEIVFDKIISYEKTPTQDDSFYSTVTCSTVFDGYRNVFFDDNHHICEAERLRGVLSTENIVHYLRDSIQNPMNVKRIYLNTSSYADSPDFWFWNDGLFAQGGQLPSELRNPDIWTGNRQNITDSINAGTLFLTYIGHGSNTTWQNHELFWHDDIVLYSDSDCSQLTNKDKYPVICSMSCNTGNYQNSEDCPAEFFLKKEDGGAVAVIAPSCESLGGYTEYLTEGLINAVWPHPGINQLYPVNNAEYELGKALRVAKTWLGYMRLFDSLSHQPSSLYNEDAESYALTLEEFHLFGDPSLHIFTEKPHFFEDVRLLASNDSIRVVTGIPGTRVSFSFPIHELSLTFEGSNVRFPYEEFYYDSIVICVDKHNYVPCVVTFHPNIRIQNETIDNTRVYAGKDIQIGRNVLNNKPQGNVIIGQDAKVDIHGGNVVLQPGTFIKRGANVRINQLE